MQQRTCVACFGVKRHVLRCCTWRCMFHHVLTPFTHPLNLDFTFKFHVSFPYSLQSLSPLLSPSLSLPPTCCWQVVSLCCSLVAMVRASRCVCVQAWVWVCVCVCVGKPEPEGVGRRLKVTQKQSHIHTVASGPETWTCADMLSVLTGHSERSVHRCNVYTTYVCVYVWERESEREKEG